MILLVQKIPKKILEKSIQSILNPILSLCIKYCIHRIWSDYKYFKKGGKIRAIYVRISKECNPPEFGIRARYGQKWGRWQGAYRPRKDFVTYKIQLGSSQSIVGLHGK